MSHSVGGQRRERQKKKSKVKQDREKEKERSKINRHVFSPSDLQPSLCWFLLPLADSEAQSQTSHQPLQIFRHYSSRLLFPVFPLSGGGRRRGYISAINIPTDFSEQQLGNKRPYASKLTDWVVYPHHQVILLLLLASFRSPEWWNAMCSRLRVFACAAILCSPRLRLWRLTGQCCHLQEGRRQECRERGNEWERRRESADKGENVTRMCHWLRN